MFSSWPHDDYSGWNEKVNRWAWNYGGDRRKFIWEGNNKVLDLHRIILWTILFFISRENIMSVAWGNRPGFSVVSVGKQVSSKVWSLKTIFISDRISSFYIVNYWLKVRNTIRHAHFLKIVPRYIKIIDQIFGNFHSEIVELQIYILKYHQLCHIINCTCWTC